MLRSFLGLSVAEIGINPFSPNVNLANVLNAFVAVCTKKGAIKPDSFNFSNIHPLHPQFRLTGEPKGKTVAKPVEVKVGKGKEKLKIVVSFFCLIGYFSELRKTNILFL